jgi:DNA mismatch repair ATPase MutS
VLCAHWAIVQTAIYAHSKSAIQKGWTLPKLIDNLSYEETKDSKIELRGLIPYWINRYSATPNDIDLSGIFLLTAPNMSGKSTIMRSSLVAALLGNCGLFIPASSAIISRFNNFFLRTASYDVPSEGKSAFALEMDDVRVVLRDSTSQSLVMIDELG